MPPILTHTIQPDGKRGLHVDLRAFEDPMREALRRAAVFLGYAFHSSEGAPLKSVRLKAPIVLEVGMPDPIPCEDRKSYQNEFKQWAIGQGLIEIDQSYHRYVVSALDALADIDDFVMQGSLPEPRKPNLANTWKVHSQFYATVSQLSPEHENESDYLRSLVNARNCLAHDSGVVTKRRLVDSNLTMPMRWPGRDMVKVDQRGNRIVLQPDVEHRVCSQDIGSVVSIEEVVRERSYAEGERIQLTETDLSEIIFFYQIIAMRLGSEMHRIVRKRIEFANKR